MILRSLTKHLKEQNWFAVFLDFFIVVMGILIAFQITNWNELQQEKANLASAEEALKRDLLSNYVFAQERLALVECRKISLRALGDKLLEPNSQWQGISREYTDINKNLAFKNVLRSPSRTWGSRIWDTELARGTFNTMDIDRRNTLDTVFTQTKHVEILQREIIGLQASLKVLSQTTDLPVSDRLRYFDRLSEIDEKSGWIENISKQIAGQIEVIGIDIPIDVREEMRGYLAEQNKSADAIYGECRKLMVVPFILEPDMKSTSKSAEETNKPINKELKAEPKKINENTNEKTQ